MKYVVTFGGSYFINELGEIVRDFNLAKKFTIGGATAVAARLNKEPKSVLGIAKIWEAEVIIN